MKHLFTLSEWLRAKWERLATLASSAMQSLKATKRQSDTTIFAKSLKSLMSIFAESVKVSKFHDIFAERVQSAKSIFANRGVKDVRVSLGQYPTNIQRISNLYLTPNSFFTRIAAVFALVFVLGVGNVWGATQTFTYASSGGWTTTGGTQSGTLNGITIAATNGALNASNSQIRVYSGAIFTVSSNYTITKIQYTYSNAAFALKSDSPGSYDSNTKVWTGSGNSISFTNNGQVRISTMTVTYTIPSGHSITYHCNGATSGCPSNASGQSALPNPLPTPSRTGCTFAGWYTNEGLTTAAVAGATLSADANLYAKWTTNVTLNRNGVTETINDVVVGTDLDEIDGSGDQGGCSAWTFVGWSKTQRAAQNVSTEMTLVTEVDGPGPYYAVYSHTESGGTTDLSKTETFENQSESTTYNSTQNYNANSSNASIAWTMYYGTVSTNAVLTDSKSAQMRWYSSAKSNIPYIATTTPISGLQTLTFNAAVGNTNIKMKVEKSTDGSTWTAVATNITMTTSKDDYSVDINGTIGTNYYIKIGVDGGNSTAPSSGNYTFRVDDVKFDYTASGGSTTYYSTTASCCQPLAQINGSINLSHF